MNNITDAQKIYDVSKIWKEAAYNFAFWDKVDVDWDAEYKKTLARVLETKDLYDYYCELKRFITLLNDGHTDVSFPNALVQDAKFFSILPVRLTNAGNEIVVIAVSEAVKNQMV